MHSGFINIYKEKGYTSHDVVNIVRKLLGKIKTGHTGTLDPDASGVLPICVGKATKLADYITRENKSYTAVLRLGIETDTEDMTGNIICKKDVNLNFEQIELAVLSFQGEYFQTPPMYSAIKVNGKKLYELARQGKEIERKQRKITINKIAIKDFNGYDTLTIDVDCSKGTYIRTLCKDIGDKLFCGGVMESLIRTRTGRFLLDDSIKIDEFRKLVETNNYENVILKVDDILTDYKKAYVMEEANKYLYNGNKINTAFVKTQDVLCENENFIVYNNALQIVGIYSLVIEDNVTFIKPVIMLY